MSEQYDQQDGQPGGHPMPQDGGEFARLATFARRGSALPSPERIRALGSRRMQRRRAGQAVLGTGTLAAAVLLGVGIANNSGHGQSTLNVGSSVGSTPRASASAASAKPKSKDWTLPIASQLIRATESQVEKALEKAGFTLSTRSVASSTIPAGNAVDIVDAQNKSVLGLTVNSDTPLILLVSSGPAH